jgi:heme a synthase
MVKSGFKDKPEYQMRPRVSTYRLFVHLGTALVLYSNLLWNALTLLRNSSMKNVTPANLASMLRGRRLAGALLHFVAFNLISGAMVAGIDAGKVFNDWPFMNGQLENLLF